MALYNTEDDASCLIICMNTCDGPADNFELAAQFTYTMRAIRAGIFPFRIEAAI